MLPNQEEVLSWQHLIAWLQILSDGTRKWYERSNGGWTLVKTEPGGLTGEFEGTFKKIKIVNGMVTEFELD